VPSHPIFRTAALVLALAPATTAQPQTDAFPADTATVDLAPVVVTATRSAKELADVAAPVTVVSEAQIRQQGATRLADVLETLPGLQVVEDHGTGLQVQGFSSEYTLILLDGQPIVGRAAGTLDLDRLTVQGLERVEVVRGPSSSLYGSEAMAGVVNLITRRPRGTSGSVETRLGTHGQTGLTANAEAGTDRAGVRLLLDRYGSDGYDLDPAAYGPTAPAFSDWTGDLRARFEPSATTRARLGVRLARQDQQSRLEIDEGGAAPTRMDDAGQRTEWSVHPEIEQRLGSRLRLRGTLYGAGYATETRYTRQADGSVYYEDDFDQRLGRAETQLDGLWSAHHRTAVGVGGQVEALVSTRYEGTGGARPRALHGWAYAQHEWMPSRLLEVTASARFDRHEDYAPRLSPKLAVLVRPVERVRLRASVGSGFRAPDFRQLYLSFTNAAAGYSVFGSTQLQSGLAQLQEEGQIEEVLRDAASLGAIRAERSVGTNAGIAWEPVDGLLLSADLFHNDVTDLIETQPVARKANGQFVYGYYNQAGVYTRGAQLESSYAPAGRWAGLTLAAGYQYLQARDRVVERQIEAGTLFGRGLDGRDYRLALSDYAGLFGRSPHSATLRAAYAFAPTRTTLSLRGRWRSAYGYADVDGNGVANRPDERVGAYGVLDATLTQRVGLPGRSALDLQLGLDNALGLTRPGQLQTLTGRQVYVSARLSL
jgi:outer membrane receptor for ferrienterochelin and colicins